MDNFISYLSLPPSLFMPFSLLLFPSDLSRIFTAQKPVIRKNALRLKRSLIIAAYSANSIPGAIITFDFQLYALCWYLSYGFGQKKIF